MHLSQQGAGNGPLPISRVNGNFHLLVPRHWHRRCAPHTWHPPSPSPQPPHHRLCHHHDRFPGVLVAVSPPPRPPLSSRPKRTRTGMRHPCISDRRAARGRLDLGTWYTMGLPKAQGQRSIYRLTVCVYRAYCSKLQATRTDLFFGAGDKQGRLRYHRLST